jgi:hypothetical protein
LVCTSRVIALLLLLCQSIVKSPVDWRNLQLNGLSKEIEYVLFLGQIHNYLRRCFPQTENIHEVLKRVSMEFYASTKERLCVAIDEANVLVESHVNIFRSRRDPSLPRPLWTLVGATLSEFNSIALFLAGTTIGLGDQDILHSAKAGVDAGRRMTLQTNFRLVYTVIIANIHSDLQI